MLLDAQVEMTARVAYIIRITRITLKFVHNALLVYKRGLCFRNFQIFRDFPTCEDWLQYMNDFVTKVAQLPAHGVSRFLIFKRQGYQYRAVDWFSTALILILGSVKCLKNRSEIC